MEDSKILKLLQSPILEDTLIGINILMDTKSVDEIVEFFNVNANHRVVHSFLRTYGCINRKLTDYYVTAKYYYRGTIGILLTHRVFLLNHVDGHIKAYNGEKI